MKDGDFGTDGRECVHRLASVLVWLGWVGWAASRNGIGSGAQMGLALLLPLGCVWFPRVLGAWRGMGFGWPHYIGSPSHPVFLRWAGWLFLLGVPAALWIQGM